MKIALFIALVFLFLFTACKNQPAGESETPSANPPVTLKLLWTTDSLLTTCESVLYDPDKNVLYVSNIKGEADAKDGNGTIAKVNLDGEIIAADWVKGLDAPKGLGMSNGMLYVADIDQIVEIDTETGEITKKYPVPGAQFLNDITVDTTGKIYASDSNTGRIAALFDGQVATWLDNVKGPNGLLADRGQFYVLSWGDKTLSMLDPESGKLRVKAEGLEGPDGLEALSDSSFMVSSWYGTLSYVGPDWKPVLILDTRDQGFNAADIEYIPEKKMLLVPTFEKNSVMAYSVAADLKSAATKVRGN